MSSKFENNHKNAKQESSMSARRDSGPVRRRALGALLVISITSLAACAEIEVGIDAEHDKCFAFRLIRDTDNGEFAFIAGTQF